MGKGTEKIVERFPHHTIMPIVGEPNYETLNEVKLKLDTNGMSIRSHIGNIHLGLLYLTVTPAMYNTQSATPFVPPENPGPSPTVPAGSTGPQIVDINRSYVHNATIFKEYDDMDKVIKALLMLAIDKIYIRALRNRYVGYVNVTTLEMLTDMYKNCARTTPTYL